MRPVCVHSRGKIVMVMEVPPELQLPGSLEDALGAFPLLKPISPEVPASGLGRWGEVATGADPDDMDEDTVSVHDTASDAGLRGGGGRGWGCAPP